MLRAVSFIAGFASLLRGCRTAVQLGLLVLTAWSTLGAEPGSDQPSIEDAISRIRDEGLNHSRVMETLSYLTEVIGPRLTASPGHKRANEWTRDKMLSWGLTNAHLEAWGPFGRGWELKRFSVQLLEPQTLPVIAYPNAWTPGLNKPLTAEVIFLDARTTADLDKYKGKLKGAIVLASPVREVRPRFEPLATRMAETNLLRLANAGASGSRSASFRPRSRASESETTARTSGAAPTNREPRFARGRSGARFLSFLSQEGAVLVVNASPSGDGGTVFVSAASVPISDSQGTNRATSFTNTPRVWATNAPAILPQITVATEDYNRLVRMVQQCEEVRMAVELGVQFHTNDLMAYNTVAEIPGTDLKDQVVMLGAHLDSWHAGTGATDDGVGVAAVMEAARILQAVHLQPRRTIRVGLWAGEEQGLLGSKAYVSRHFGYYTNQTDSRNLRTPKDDAGTTRSAKSTTADSRSERKLVRLREYEKLSAYFNLDNGGGKIRGVYLQGNEGVRPLFRRWLEPFKDLEADTLSLSNTGGTDHLSFDTIGLPGFQFIQDPLDYNTRTHHSNQDVFDRIQPDDAKQASIILAAFAYNTAMLEERLPRKPLD